MSRRLSWLAAILSLALLLTQATDASEGDTPPQPRAVIFLDPGHGGPDGGAVFRGRGFTVVEADVNLDIALRAAARLRERGYHVVLSRQTADQPGGSEDVNGDGQNTSRDGLQAVVDQANAAGADLFLSIHHNGSADSSVAGSEVYYCADRPFADASFRLGELVLSEVRAALAREGYLSPNRGVLDDSLLYTRGAYRGHLFVLGPLRTPRASAPTRTPSPADAPRRSAPKLRATEMPGVLSEALFVSNPHEAWLLSQPHVRAALADAFADAIDRYFEP